MNAQDIWSLVKENTKIEAIKELRVATTLGLKEAKDVIDMAVSYGDDRRAVLLISEALGVKVGLTIVRTAEVFAGPNLIAAVSNNGAYVTISAGSVMEFPTSHIDNVIEALLSVKAQSRNQNWATA